MKLTQLEIQSGLWTKLVEHYTPILAKLRARAENPEMPEAERMPLLWRIKHIKDFLALASQGEKKVTGAD